MRIECSLPLGTASRQLVPVILLGLAFGHGCSTADDVAQPEAEGSRTTPVAHKIGEAGCVSCPEDTHGMAPRSVLIAGQEVWLLDSFAPHVRIFSSSGEELRAFGEAGEGPGELNLPAALARTQDGNVLVYNSVPPRLMVLRAASGELVASTQIHARVPMSLAFHAPTWTLYRLTFFFGDEHEALDRVDVRSGETAPLLPDLEDHPSLPGTEDGPLMSRRFPVVALPDGGFATGDAWHYAIRTYDRDGRPGIEITRKLPRPTAGQVEVDGFEPGSELPHFGAFALDVDSARGALWVMTHRGISSGTTVFDLFDLSGADRAFIGSVTIPVVTARDLQSFDAEDDRLVTWSEDSDTGGVLTVWSLEWGR